MWSQEVDLRECAVSLMLGKQRCCEHKQQEPSIPSRHESNVEPGLGFRIVAITILLFWD
jgi:hypothetical protein